MCVLSLMCRRIRLMFLVLGCLLIRSVSGLVLRVNNRVVIDWYLFWMLWSVILLWFVGFV